MPQTAAPAMPPCKPADRSVEKLSGAKGQNASEHRLCRGGREGKGREGKGGNGQGPSLMPPSIQGSQSKNGNIDPAKRVPTCISMNANGAAPGRQPGPAGRWQGGRPSLCRCVAVRCTFVSLQPAQRISPKAARQSQSGANEHRLLSRRPSRQQQRTTTAKGREGERGEINPEANSGVQTTSLAECTLGNRGKHLAFRYWPTSRTSREEKTEDDPQEDSSVAHSLSCGRRFIHACTG